MHRDDKPSAANENRSKYWIPAYRGDQTNDGIGAITPIIWSSGFWRAAQMATLGPTNTN